MTLKTRQVDRSDLTLLMCGIFSSLSSWDTCGSGGGFKKAIHHAVPVVEWPFAVVMNVAGPTKPLVGKAVSAPKQTTLLSHLIFYIIHLMYIPGIHYIIWSMIIKPYNSRLVAEATQWLANSLRFQKAAEMVWPCFLPAAGGFLLPNRPRWCWASLRLSRTWAWLQ